MPYKIVFLGLINFFELKGEKGRLVLIPDGRAGMKPEFDPDEEIVPHHASFIVRKSQVVDASGWKGSKESKIKLQTGVEVVVEFPIDEPAEISISGMVEARGTDRRTFDDSDFERKCIKLKDAIDIDPDRARTIARMPLRQGTLVSRKVKSTLAAVLDVSAYKGEVIINASPAGNLAKLDDGAEIVLVNWSGDLHGTDGGEEKNHFRLYAQLDRDKRAGELKTPEQLEKQITALTDDRKSSELESEHPFVKEIQNITGPDVPETQCTVTGCCDEWMCAQKWEAEGTQGTA